MKNNSDKQLRDKLSNTEFPFDPQAWEQMEAMLDKKKKRRGFFWWWTGGIAAALLLGVIGYEFRGLIANEGGQKIGNRKSEAVNEQLAIQAKENTTATVGGGNGQENTGAQEKTNEQLAVQTTTTNGQATTINTIMASDNPAKSETGNHQSKSNPRQVTVIKTKKHETGKNKGETASRYSSSKQKLKDKTLTAFAGKESTAGNPAAVENPFKKEIDMLNSASATSSSEENISLSRREASLLESISENPTTSFDKKEEDVLPKQKKKIFNYSLGVLANVTGASAGKQEGIPGQPTAPFFFCIKPSYMVGLTHDFLFVNRVAITNSILFSQTSFDIYNPKTVSFSSISGIYSSHITELDIPIGIKVYPVVKGNFRFYINTGIINHIKLKETFDYVSLDDTTRNATANLFDPSVFPTQTNFTGSYAPALGVQGGSTSTKDFSINSAKRYYTSFYAGAGFEFIAKKHFILFTEPMFYMSLQKIGVQDKRKYNIGLTSGFRYQF